MKDVSDQQIAEHLKRLNPWWGGVPGADVSLGRHPRAYVAPVRKLLLDHKLRRAVVPLGARRVGKATIIEA